MQLMKIRFSKTIHYEIDCHNDTIIDILESKTKTMPPFDELNVTVDPEDETGTVIANYLNARLHMARTVADPVIKNVIFYAE